VVLPYPKTMVYHGIRTHGIPRGNQPTTWYYHTQKTMVYHGIPSHGIPHGKQLPRGITTPKKHGILWYTLPWTWQPPATECIVSVHKYVAENKN